MADKIKAFFNKSRKGGKFKGKGYSLKDSRQPESSSGSADKDKPVVRVDPTEDAKQAGVAALARLERKLPNASFGKSTALFKATTTRESFQKGDPPEKTDDPRPVNPVSMAVAGVYFKCPIISGEILPKDEWKRKIEEFLREQLSCEKGLTSCLMIQTLNKNRDEVAQCVETLTTYLTNIAHNPTEEKYKKIRLSNKVFQEKVVKIEGALEFLEAAGFEKRRLPFKEDEDDFLVYVPDPVDVDNLELLVDSLVSAEPIPLEIDRNVQLLAPGVADKRTDLPSDFFRLSIDEMKREMQNRQAKIETMMQLRTKAMREKEEKREFKKYRYAVIRVRFPDCVLLQGTFNVYEKGRALKEFVREHLNCDGRFAIRNALGQELSETDDDTTLLELKLVPAALVTFSWEEPEAPPSFLKPETLLLLQS